MKSKRIIFILCSVALLAAAFLGFRIFAFRFWERSLTGPFTGIAYTGTLPSQPTSTLPLSVDSRLEFYEVPDASVPVLVLRHGTAVQWSQLLLPQRQQPNGSTSTASIRDARLQRRVFTLSGTRALFTCDWDWGGREGGLLYLASDKSFDHFGISW